ncbi:hypothetical protein [Aeromonas sp. FDAARGOS 1402]|uniref:hypothetical protein n=1 Tax=Aeromonas sp. FDAARGOS 1402 TaxID=2778051 RepID=UPI0020B31800|nr:hypothetical protein [Aeromonas sp. FDAARGOS 1402]
MAIACMRSITASISALFFAWLRTPPPGGSAVLHQGIQGAEGLLEALADAAIGPLEVQPQGLGSLAKVGGALPPFSWRRH